MAYLTNRSRIVGKYTRITRQKFRSISGRLLERVCGVTKVKRVASAYTRCVNERRVPRTTYNDERLDILRDNSDTSQPNLNFMSRSSQIERNGLKSEVEDLQ